MVSESICRTFSFVLESNSQYYMWLVQRVNQIIIKIIRNIKFAPL